MEELISPPSSVKISSATPIFTSIGSTSQLTVTATYPDQSTKDITNGSTGTVYRSTNTAIATVSQNGLVTATGRGNVIISASNDMVLSSIMFTIIPMDILTSDNDNDGLPDDWEILNGMNPDDPIDAQEDFDNDGLKNIDEYNNGTGLHVADTDGDSITNVTDWRINGTSIALVNIPFENNSYDLSGSNGIMTDHSTFSNNASGK